MFQEDSTPNLARQEAVNAHLDALMKDLSNSKADVEVIENDSHTRGWKGKTVGAGSGSESGGNSIFLITQNWIFHDFLATNTPWDG